MLGLLLLVVVLAAVAVYEPWTPPLLVETRATRNAVPRRGHDVAPNDWARLFLSTLYRLGGGEDTHPA